MEYKAKAIIDRRYPVEEVGSAIYQQMLYIAAMVDTEHLANISTDSGYKRYLQLCRMEGYKPYFNKITFSKFVIKTFGYGIENVRRKGKKYRVFRKEPPVRISR